MMATPQSWPTADGPTSLECVFYHCKEKSLVAEDRSGYAIKVTMSKRSPEYQALAKPEGGAQESLRASAEAMTSIGSRLTEAERDEMVSLFREVPITTSAMARVHAIIAEKTTSEERSTFYRLNEEITAAVLDGSLSLSDIKGGDE